MNMQSCKWYCIKPGMTRSGPANPNSSAAKPSRQWACPALRPPITCRQHCLWPPPWNRAGHYIFALCFLPSSLWPPCIADADIIFLPRGFFFLSFYIYLPIFLFLVYSQPLQIVCLPYFHTWCGLSANLGCRSETCCTRLAEIQDAKNRQKFAIWAPSHNFVGLHLRN